MSTLKDNVRNMQARARRGEATPTEPLQLAELELIAQNARALRDNLQSFVSRHGDRFTQPESKSALIHAKVNVAHAAMTISGVIDREGEDFAAHLKVTAVAMARSLGRAVVTNEGDEATCSDCGQRVTGYITHPDGTVDCGRCGDDEDEDGERYE